MDTIPNAAGCDSVMTFNLTITGATSNATDVVSSCGSYTWRDGNVYSLSTNSVTYLETGVAAGPVCSQSRRWDRSWWCVDWLVRSLGCVCRQQMCLQRIYVSRPGLARGIHLWARSDHTTFHPSETR